MATVRFSKEFKDSILKNARAVFKSREKSVDEALPNKWGDTVYDIVFADFIPALNNVPTEFLNMQDTFRFGGFIEVDTLQSVSFSMPLSSKRPFPSGDNLPSGLETKVKRVGYYNNEFKLRDLPEFADFKTELLAWQVRKAEVAKQEREFVSAVQKVIEAHATLAPALKMWPPLWDLVNEEYRDRHREVVERVKPSEKVQALEEEGINLSALTATVVAHKLTK